MSRVAYLFTTFPKLSEQFFLREVLELQKQGVAIDLYSIVGGQDESEAGPVVQMNAWAWVCLAPELIYWLLRKPTALGSIVRIFFTRYGSWTNLGENLIGAAFALRFARLFRRKAYDFTHATWATAPGMAAYALRLLIGQCYTLEAHAYDVFRNGGDSHLALKLSSAKAVRSSTESTAHVLRDCVTDSVPPVYSVRRGLPQMPDYQEPSKRAGPLQVLSVGRLIEKKGYFQQLKIYAAWKREKVPFRATIIGEGPLRGPLESAVQEYGLSGDVDLVGRLEYAEVERYYRTADLFLFTGVVSVSGDRDGFPNVIAEAMSYSLPVFSSDVSAITEVIADGTTGFIIDVNEPSAAARQISVAMAQRELLKRVTGDAHDWLLSSFDVKKNMSCLKSLLWE
jgi:glycosyltransferase involved in cell wall biosynthesis